MCGYIEVNGEQSGPAMLQRDFSDYLSFPPQGQHKVFYPAFGKYPNKTTFSARKLQSPFWKHSLQNQRTFVFATVKYL